MATLTLHARGPLPADEAWERYAQPALWPGWAPQIVRVECPGGRIAPGLRGRVVGPLGVAVRFVVNDVDEPARTWSWTATAGPLRVRLHHEIHPDGAGTATSLRLRAPLPVALGYAPVARLALHRLVHR